MSDKGSIFDQFRKYFGKPKDESSADHKGDSLTKRGDKRAAVTPPPIKRGDEPVVGSPPPITGGGLVVPRVVRNDQTEASAAASTGAMERGSDSGPQVDLMLGVDLGTSCTKVVIGDHGWLGQSYAVPVGWGDSGLERFLRPTQLEIGGQFETNLKLRLMADPGSQQVRDLLVLYLAGVIRDSIRWFEDEGSGRYRGRTPKWSLNVGFPAKQVSGGPLVDAYEDIASLAAYLAPLDVELTHGTVSSARNEVAQDDPSRAIPNKRIRLYPEIAAQLAGYVNSPFRAQGNLILIDVGAGTLDVSTVILHGNQDEDVVSFHFCEVGPYGALKLLEARYEAMHDLLPGGIGFDLGDFQSGTTPLPETTEEMFGDWILSHEAQGAFDESSDKFALNATRVAISCASRFSKRQRDAHLSASFDPWPGRVRLFFTGGGSRVGFYRENFLEGPFEQELTRFTRWKRTEDERHRHHQGLRLEPLPKPLDLKGLPDDLADDFDRLSVAHGLAYGTANLMKITSSVHS